MCSSCVPCEKLSRKTSTPASTSFLIMAGAFEAGPRVATIFVLTCPSGSNLEFVMDPHRENLDLSRPRSLRLAAPPLAASFYSAAQDEGKRIWDRLTGVFLASFDVPLPEGQVMRHLTGDVRPAKRSESRPLSERAGW